MRPSIQQCDGAGVVPIDWHDCSWSMDVEAGPGPAAEADHPAADRCGACRTPRRRDARTLEPAGPRPRIRVATRLRISHASRVLRRRR